jgi:broad specificity phosphatase PhoE
MTASPPPDTTLLYLVRHGATEANERKPYILQGRGVNYGLSASGKQQAESVAQFLRGFPIRHVYSSCLLRSTETAQAIARFHQLEVEQIDDLAECHVGQWEGKDWGTIMREFPEAYEAFLRSPGEAPYLGGESYGDVLRRVQPVLAGLLGQHTGEAIVVVAHNVVNRAYLGHLLGLEPRKAKDLRQANCCVNVIQHRGGETQVLTLNAHFHVPGALH